MRDIVRGARALVTGGLGFIGSHLVRRLLAGGAAAVTVIDCRPPDLPDRLSDCSADPRLRIVRGTLLDVALVTSALEGHERVLHLGASTIMRSDPADLRRDVDCGIRATLSVLEAMRRTGTKHIVFSSSSAVYGALAAEPVSEDRGPLLPLSAYGAAKLAAEGLISAHCHLTGNRATLLRFGNIIGEGMDHGLIYDVVRRLAAGERAISLLGNGTQARTYMLVERCVEAILRLAGLPLGDGACDVCNVSGAGRVTSVELVRIIERALGAGPVDIRHRDEERGWPGDVPVVDLDLGKLRSRGFVPERSTEAVASAARALRRHFDAGDTGTEKPFHAAP